MAILRIDLLLVKGISYFSDIDAKIIPYSLDEATRNAPNLSVYPYESYFASNYSELEFSPSCYTHMWLGRDNKLYKSEDNGNSFDVVHTFGDSDEPVLNFEISRADPLTMYVYQRTTYYGAVLWVTRDGGDNWEEKSFPDADSQRSGLLQVHSEKPGTLWVSFGHHRNDGTKIFLTEDYGETWTNFSSPILNNDIVSAIYLQPGTENLFLATYLGIYMYNGTDWEVCSRQSNF